MHSANAIQPLKNWSQIVSDHDPYLQIISNDLFLQGANQPPPQPMKPSELYYSKITPALKEKVRPWYLQFP